MQSTPRIQVPNKVMQKVQESVSCFDLSLNEAVSSPAMSKGILFS